MMHKVFNRERSGATLLIGLVAGAVIASIGGVYYFLFTTFLRGWIGGVAVIGATLAVLAALVYVIWQRLHEIAQENPDDYRKY
ncbi:MAG: hypothetical protein WCY01_13750 [Alkalispirochaeta sp.]|jgi:hypothetical protein